MGKPLPSIHAPEFDDVFQVKIFTRLTNDPEYSAGDAVADILKYEVEETTFRIQSADSPWPWKLFYCFLEVVRRTSEVEKMDRLIPFLMELEKHKVYNPETGEQVKHEKWYAWNELPYFEWAASDELTTCEFDSHNPLPRSEQRTRQDNIIIFFARLSNATQVPYSHHKRPFSDATLAAIGTFSVAFQQNECRRRDEKLAATRHWCLWLIHAAERLLTNAQRGPCWPTDDIEVMLPKDWEIWRNTTKTARDKYDEDTTRLVDEALRSMRAAEDKHGGPYSIKDAKSS